ncbi:hypothetical protein KI688_010461 [Linnemannia hyalina]|uniref:Acyl-coenzyme A oxidase n=1 Tax=Linnemannia hyalina TaxID=64524 RepID=A0A9P7XYP0_9FUNG|nr:hypothetical protein KI688_010461 [Linnemannia hyalina]
MANNNSATSKAQLRLASLSAQLDTTAPRDSVTEILETSLPPVHLHADALSVLLDGKDQTWRKWMFEQLKHPLFEYQYNVTKEELVTRNQERTRHLAKLGFRPTWTEPKVNIDRNKFIQIQDALSYFDNGLSTMHGAHFGLYSGSIRELGSEALQNKWLPLADSFEVPGCFALTELGHGSNPRGIETEAHWDVKEGCYIINTPNTTAQKYWIGAAAETAFMSVVWAQLYIPHPTDPSHPPSHKGIHAFLIPIRDLSTRSPSPGVTIRNCGSKSGLNGVDNGRLWFDHVKVPRHMCLDKYGGVNEQGVYESFFGDNNDQRYGLTRRQFGAKQVGELETLIMDYKLHQRRLYPLLAQTYAQHFAARAIARLRDTEKSDLKLLKQFHVISSGLKSLHTWHLLDTLQATREACGGQGLKSSNRIGQMKADCDVMATYEGDNQVMLITVAKGCINDYKPTRIPTLANFTSQHFSDSTLLSPKFQLDLFQHHIHASAHRLHAAIDLSRAQAKAQGTPNIGLDNILDTHSALSQEFARAVLEHWILSEFIAQETLSAATTTSATGTSPLTLMRQLHALWKLDMDQNMIRRRYLDEPVQERIRNLVGGLLHRVHENITPLVDAFGVPDHLLGPIAHDWVQANVADSEDI